MFIRSEAPTSRKRPHHGESERLLILREGACQDAFTRDSLPGDSAISGGRITLGMELKISGGVGRNSRSLISSSSSSLGIGSGSTTGSSSSSNIGRHRTKTRRQTSGRLQTLRCCCGSPWLIRIPHLNGTPQAQTIVPPNSVPESVADYQMEEQHTLESRAKKMNSLIFRVLNKTQPVVCLLRAVP